MQFIAVEELHERTFVSTQAKTDIKAVTELNRRISVNHQTQSRYPDIQGDRCGSRHGGLCNLESVQYLVVAVEFQPHIVNRDCAIPVQITQDSRTAPQRTARTECVKDRLPRCGHADARHIDAASQFTSQPIQEVDGVRQSLPNHRHRNSQHFIAQIPLDQTKQSLQPGRQGMNAVEQREAADRLTQIGQNNLIAAGWIDAGHLAERGRIQVGPVDLQRLRGRATQVERERQVDADDGIERSGELARRQLIPAIKAIGSTGQRHRQTSRIGRIVRATKGQAIAVEDHAAGASSDTQRTNRRGELHLFAADQRGRIHARRIVHQDRSVERTSSQRLKIQSDVQVQLGPRCHSHFCGGLKVHQATQSIQTRIGQVDVQ